MWKREEEEEEGKEINEKISFNHFNCHLGENERKWDQMMFVYTAWVVWWKHLYTEFKTRNEY